MTDGTAPFHTMLAKINPTSTIANALTKLATTGTNTGTDDPKM
jgi:hypothetical protein